jgi:hypothetical protein
MTFYELKPTWLRRSGLVLIIFFVWPFIVVAECWREYKSATISVYLQLRIEISDIKRAWRGE